MDFGIVASRNFGVVLSSSDLIVDVDPRNFKDGVNSFTKLCTDLGLTEFNTFIVRTGGGGTHLYYRKPAELMIKYKLKDYPGIEFKTEGGQVVGAGCIHPDTMKTYDIYRGVPSTVVECPAPLLARLKADAQSPDRVVTREVKYFDNEQTVNKYKEFLKHAEPAREGEQGDHRTFAVAAKGRDLGLSPDKTFELMAEVWNYWNEPPWELEELAKKVQNAYSYGKNTIGESNPEVEFPDLPQEERKKAEQDAATTGTANWASKIRWDLDAKGKPVKNLHNCVNYLSHPDLAYSSRLKYNEMAAQIEIHGGMPWDDPHEKRDIRMWGDMDSVQVKYNISRQCQFELPKPIIQEAALIVAKRTSYHPLRGWLDTLVWDGKNRLDSWLPTVTGCCNNAYTRAVGRKVLVAAVARVFVPGIKFDHMVVLEGQQRIGKSTLCSILGGDYYADVFLDPHSKDTVQGMQGRWIIEVSEMECTKRSEVNALKGFISRGTDRIRMPYAANTEDVRRQSIFIGTINPETGRGYLRDGTGNTRFWPVWCEKVDLDWAKNNRDQLFAEAMAVWKTGKEKLFLETIEERGFAAEQTKDRTDDDPWVDTVGMWIQRKINADGFSINKDCQYELTALDVWLECFGGLAMSFGRVEQGRINDALQNNGWEKTNLVRRYRNVRGFVKDAETGL